ncbi:hypothetical protein Ahy_B05g077336 [Arachis hypogaea]|uniref:Replication protein A 70 kDa DNA-binding subunit B/D first OB fold domain-containing protein n=1 Tax=Arachis hypogaea TaxID=3818 RepID=A0A444Z4S2_ARAHY|nr:hypothetical protein Ahy_B05g077336 [Arachis hypogaea]
MDEHFDLVSDVNAKKLAWNFKVFVVKVCTTPNKFNVNEIGSIEMVLQDKHGGRIYATIPRSLAKKYISVILEFYKYTMSNFIVVDNMTKKKNGVSRWVLVLSHRTRVEHIENPTFSLEAFRFRNLAEVHTVEKVEDLELFVIIGEVVGKENPRELVTSKGIETKRLVVIVEDLEYSPTLMMIDLNRLLWSSNILKHPDGMAKLQCRATLNCPSLLSGSELTSVRISHLSTQSSWAGTDELNNGTTVVKNDRRSFEVFMKVCDDEETVAKNEPKKMDVSTSMNITDSMEDCVESLKYKTPAKRIAGSLKCGSVVDEECQVSTNRFTQKGRKKQKSHTSNADN